MGALALSVLAIVRRRTHIRRGLGFSTYRHTSGVRPWRRLSGTATERYMDPIAFASLPNAAMAESVILGAVTIVAIMVARRSNGGRSHVDNGGL